MTNEYESVPVWNAPLVANTKPNHNIKFHNDNQKEVGVLDFNGPQLEFTGDAATSAQVFIEYVASNFRERLLKERLSLIKDIESLGFATEEQEATAKIIIHYLRSLTRP